jgi:hypothetical protein
MTSVRRPHDAVKWGDVAAIAAPLDEDHGLARARSETEARGPAALGRAGAARVLLRHATRDGWPRSADLLRGGGATE